jgi:hypothetical protein
MAGEANDMSVHWGPLLEAAEMAALSALCARRGVAWPYGGQGWSEEEARQLEDAAVGLLAKAEGASNEQLMAHWRRAFEERVVLVLSEMAVQAESRGDGG